MCDDLRDKCCKTKITSDVKRHRIATALTTTSSATASWSRKNHTTIFTRLLQVVHFCFRVDYCSRLLTDRRSCRFSTKIIMASKHGEKEMIPICFNNINGRVTFHQDVHASLAGSDPKNALLRFSLVVCFLQTPTCLV